MKEVQGLAKGLEYSQEDPGSCGVWGVVGFSSELLIDCTAFRCISSIR